MNSTHLFGDPFGCPLLAVLVALADPELGIGQALQRGLHGEAMSLGAKKC